MSSVLSEQDKLTILALAGGLVLFTALLTICLVLPACPVHRRLLAKVKKHKEKNKQKIALQSRRFVSPNHLRLSIVPVYTSTSIDHDLTPQLSPRAKSFGGRNQFENLTCLAEKTRLRYCSLKPGSIKTMPMFPKICFKYFGYETTNESSFKICFKIEEVIDLNMTEYQAEPSCYLSFVLIGYKQPRNPSIRKSIIHKASQTEIFRTETVRRCLTPKFQKHTFTSEELPKCFLRDGCLKLRLIDEEKNANDICLGELIVPLKKLNNLQMMSGNHVNDHDRTVAFNDKAVDQESLQTKAFQINENSNGQCPDRHSGAHLSNSNDSSTNNSNSDSNKNNNNNSNSDGNNNSKNNNNDNNLTFTLFPIKEAKGELFAGFCYLPTSRRINITIVKANLRSNSQLSNSNSATTTGSRQNALQQAFYVRILMFQDGKLVRKKRSSASVKLIWGDNETIGFDLTDELASDLTSLSFMLVLSYRTQYVTSPSSPEDEEPDIDENQSLIDLDAVPRTRRSSSKTNKDCHIGHFVLDNDSWIEEVVKRPRKQVLKWFRLF